MAVGTIISDEVKSFVEKIMSNFETKITYTQFLRVVKVQVLELSLKSNTNEKKLSFFQEVEKHLTVKAIIEHLPK